MDPELTRDALQHVLESESFAGKQRPSALLKYLVEEELDGRGDLIKAYAIGVDVLGRPASFDPAQDSIVRVEMGRLRSALERYNLGEGRTSPLRFEIPKGGYRVVGHAPLRPLEDLVLAPDATDDLDTGTVISTGAPGWRSLAFGALVLLALGAASLWWYFGRPAQDVETPPIVELRQFEGELGNKTLGYIVAGVSAQIADDLSHFRTLRVRTRRSQETGLTDTIRPADYRVSGRISQDEQHFHVAVWLAEAKSDETVWGKSYEIPQDSADFHHELTRIVHRIAAEIGSPSGLVTAEAISRLDVRSQAYKSSSAHGYACVLRWHAYDLSKDPEMGEAARRCLDHVIAADTTDGSAWAAYSFLTFLDWASSGEGKNSRQLDKALAAANRAIQLDPSGAAGHEYQGSILMAQGAHESAAAAYRRALDLNPSKPDLYILLGVHDALAGDWDDAVKLVETGIEMSPAPPGWFRIVLAMDAFRQAEWDAAMVQADLMIASGDRRGAILGLVPAIAAGNETRAAEYRAYLREQNLLPTEALAEIRNVVDAKEILAAYRLELLQN